MILELRISNYKSYKDEIVLNLNTGKFRTNEEHVVNVHNNKFLKFTSIFGANASGKSNIINALELIIDLQKYGSNFIVDNLYYRGSDNQMNKPSLFELKIKLNDRIYTYGLKIKFNEKRIIEEYLYDSTTSKKVIYYRDVLNGTYVSMPLNGSISNCLFEMSNNFSFTFLSEINRRLSMINNNDDTKSQILVDIYNFLMNDLIIIKPNTHKIFSIDLLENIDEKTKILNEFDINIKNLEIVDDNMNTIKNMLPEKAYADIVNNINQVNNKDSNFTLRVGNNVYILKVDENNQINVKTFKFRHNDSNDYFGTYEESDGTLRALELLDIIFAQNKIFIIDEMDNSLHPLLLKSLLKKFFETNNSNQLIITTHDTHIMDYDFIRRDEIWFTAKKQNGESTLYSLEQIKDKARSDIKYEKAYLNNKFGAVSLYEE